ncbi:MAG: hypothetical protein HYZ72_07805 [Deltaproteobacteria bacterium]|nr:hypothetical protein [Deltaproteobacteria bacterium]
MLGIKDFWSVVASKMPGKPSKEDVMKQLREIATRRNQIVHEADLVRKIKSKQLTLREVKHAEAKNIVDWTKNFVGAIEQVVP